MVKKRTKRSNGEGTISFEADRNKYRAFITDSNGKRVSKRFDTKAEASAWLAETRVDIMRGDYVPSSDITFGEWLVDYITTYRKGKVRNTTYDGYLYLCQYIDPIADCALQSLDSYILQRFFNDLDLAVASKYVIKRLLNHCLNKAVDLQIIKSSPMKSVELPPIPATEIEVFTQDEVNKILNFMKDHKIYRHHHTFVALAFASGMRIGELCGLKIKNVHDDYVYVENTVKRIGKEIFDNPPKTNRSIRRISLPRELCQALREQHGGDPTEYVFHTSAMRPHDYSNVRTRWARILKHCNLPFKNFHVTRHTHATLLIYAGVPITEISRRLGHTKISTTLNTYAHFFEDYDAHIAEKVDEMFDLTPNCPHIVPKLDHINFIFYNLLTKN